MEVLKRMEQLLPHKILPMDPRLKFDIARFYSSDGDTAMVRAYSAELINELEPIAAKRQKEQISYYSSYVMLFNSYLAMGREDKAADLVKLLKEVYAGEQGLDGFIAQLNSQIAANRNPLAGTTAGADSTPDGTKGR
jgi:hypothetical protein